MNRTLIIYFLLVATISALLVYYLTQKLTIDPPKVNYLDSCDTRVVKVNDSLWVCGSSWLHQSKTGLYEMLVEGSAFRRGYINGKLSSQLVYKQEKAFVDQISRMIPSFSYLRLLRFLLAITNKDLDKYIKPEFLQEIYGVSLSASSDFNYIGSKYQRMLNYHAAHDIGHMLQNYNLVGCTSFAAWEDKSEDSLLIIGRNFDFYVGDKFAEDKIVCFVKPDSGYNFMMITWGGMSGVVSGMNEKGLTVTINASKSYIPVSTATPISLVARHILQYAENISEAVSIAGGYKTFVSESILVGSASQNEACIIEKSPFKTAIVYSDSSYLACANHYQSGEFKNDRQNSEHKYATPTDYRYNRTKQLLHQNFPINEETTVNILRDYKGMNDENIGYTNEMCLNQFLAHHSVIFKPKKLQVWVSTSPYQSGSYVCYDLARIFSLKEYPKGKKEIYENDLSLQDDWKLKNLYYTKVKEFKKQRDNVLMKINTNQDISDKDIANFIKTNPEYFQVYYLAGEYYFNKGNLLKASEFYNQALTKKVPFKSELKNIEERIRDCSEHQNFRK